MARVSHSTFSTTSRASPVENVTRHRLTPTECERISARRPLLTLRLRRYGEPAGPDYDQRTGRDSGRAAAGANLEAQGSTRSRAHQPEDRTIELRTAHSLHGHSSAPFVPRSTSRGPGPPSPNRTIAAQFQAKIHRGPLPEEQGTRSSSRSDSVCRSRCRKRRRGAAVRDPTQTPPASHRTQSGFASL